MHDADSPFWRVDETADGLVLTALHVRDALGVAHAGGVPRLRTSPDAAFEADAALTAAWHRWFARAVWQPLDGFTAFSTDEWQSDGLRARVFGDLDAMSVDDQALLRPPVRRVLGGALERARADGRRYGEQRRREHRLVSSGELQPDLALQHTVRSLADQAGRAPRGFSLRVLVAPLADEGVWWIDDATIIVTDAVRLDREQWGTRLEPVLAALV